MAFDRSTEPKPAEKTAPMKDGPVLLPAIAQLGVPVGVFGITFFLIAVLITFLFSPDRFPVRVGDKTVRLTDLETEERTLKITQADLLEERRRILAESDAPILHQVEKLRSNLPPVGAAMLAVENVRRSFRSGTTDPISLPGVSYVSGTQALALAGDVQDTGDRSMQILATFVDELRAIPAFESVSEPEYASNVLPDGGTVSHFSLTIRFRHE